MIFKTSSRMRKGSLRPFSHTWREMVGKKSCWFSVKSITRVCMSFNGAISLSQDCWIVECCHFMAYTAAQNVCEPTFRRNVSPPFTWSKISQAICWMLVPFSSDFRPWRWRWYVLPKRQFTYELRGSISQKMATFITTAVRTSNHTYWITHW
jgi:hypothetical protein